jgi:DNA-binding MarR family transcriptional regulator
MPTSDSRFSQCLYFTASSLARKTEKLAKESWKPLGISPSHGYLLMLTLEEPGIQPSLIAEQLQLQPSTVTRLLDKLEEMNLVHRITEGKITCVFPSNKAKSLHPQMKKCIMTFAENYQRILGQKESHSLVKTMARIADKLDT